MESNWKVFNASNIGNLQRSKDRSSVDCQRANTAFPTNNDQSEVSTEKADWIILDGNRVSVYCYMVCHNLAEVAYFVCFIF